MGSAVIKSLLVLLGLVVGYVIAEMLFLKGDITLFPMDDYYVSLLSIATIMLPATIVAAVVQSKRWLGTLSMLWLGFTWLFFGFMFDAVTGDLALHLRTAGAIISMSITTAGWYAICNALYR